MREMRHMRKGGDSAWKINEILTICGVAVGRGAGSVEIAGAAPSRTGCREIAMSGLSGPQGAAPRAR